MSSCSTSVHRAATPHLPGPPASDAKRSQPDVFDGQHRAIKRELEAILPVGLVATRPGRVLPSG